MIIVEKDRHMTSNEPFFSALKDYDNYLLNSDLNNENNTFISLGDWYNLSIPKPREVDESERFFNEFKPKKIIIAGNHDFSGSDKTWSIRHLRNIKNLEIVLGPCVKKIEGKTFAFLPYYRNLPLLSEMQECYTQLKDEFISADYVCYHFEDETISFGKNKKGIDISYLKGKRLGGHIHCSQKNYEIGMPVISRYDERGQKNNLFCIDNNKEDFISIPKFLDYYDVKYGEKLPKVEAKYPLWNIKKAPSRSLAYSFYNINPEYIHDIDVVNVKEKDIKKNSNDTSIISLFEDYIGTRDDLIDDTISRLKNIVAK